MARATWVVVAAVAAVAIAAVVDALPADVLREEEPPATSQANARPPRTPAAFDAGGTLFYTDELCRLRAVRLPRFAPADAPEWDDCAFSLSPDGEGVLGAGVAWQRQGGLRVAGVSGLVYVVHDPAAWQYRVPGEAPAFKPDGTLTFARDGEIIELTGFCRPPRRVPWCERVLLTSRDLFGRLRADPGGRDAAPVKAIGWLTPTRLVVAFGGVGDDLIAVYEGKTLVHTISGFGGRVTELLVSPRRHYAAARLRQPDGFVLLDHEGEPFVLAEVRRDISGRPPFTGGRALAWSPDDAWTAIARRKSIVFFRMGSEQPDVVHVPLVARDLAWVSAPADEPAPDHIVEGSS